MKRTSLEVAKQFNIAHGTLVQRIERFIYMNDDNAKHYKQKSYKTNRNRRYVMYSMDEKGYEILLDWTIENQINRIIRRLKDVD